MADEVDISGIPHKELMPLIDKMKAKIKNDPVIKEIFKKYGIDTSEIDLVPMCFAKIPVSARTDHGVVYLNIKLVEDGNVSDDLHYLVHELTHFCQQTTGDKPTKASNDGNYLENPVEVEGFQNQIKYIADTDGEDQAEAYTDQVLESHDEEDNQECKSKLMQLAGQIEESRVEKFARSLGLLG